MAQNDFLQFNVEKEAASDYKVERREHEQTSV